MSKGLIVTAVVVVIVIGGAIGFFSGAMVPRSVVKDKLADTATKYCHEMNMDYLGGSTTGIDSPGPNGQKDGYISIDVRCKDRDTKRVERLNLECSWSMVGFPTGCKEKVSIRNQMNK